MPFYKSPDNQVHFLDSAEFENLLPGGSVQITEEEADALKPLPDQPDYSALRATAYRDESDPIFFKEQRGEALSGAWLAKVEEIKARWPQ